MQLADDRTEAAVLPMSCAVQRRLVAACVVAALSLAPLTAPVGSLLSWANQSLLNLEGRGSTTDIVQTLLKDYGSQQAAAEHDLAGGTDLSALWAENADRDSAFLVKIKGVTISSDGLAGSLNDAGQSTMAIAAKKHADDKAKAKDKTDKGNKGQPQGNGRP